MLSNGFKINECDKCVYIKGTRDSYVIVCLYVDDMLIMESNHEVKKSTKKMLTKHFDMKDLGIANTPLDMRVHLNNNHGEPIYQLEYSRIIGSLMYITNCTRPDIACAVNKLSRFTSNPNEVHWKALTRVLRYLRHTLEYGLHYTRYPTVFEGYIDANWIFDTKDFKSTSGYVFSIDGGAVSWRSSKQTCIARSTMKSEFIALDKDAEEADGLGIFWRIFLVGQSQCLQL
ncbi:secreted RxLR effector protein 161-like [Henckelia pumila]|uniref:secreted RxLR effector protein 161-like n=1 Tax=Henckelia pumila TaxID=405737 RepID=UPI003C6E641E